MRRLKAKVGLFYPKPECLQDVIRAGGFSRLVSEIGERRAGEMYKEVKAGDFCDDVPSSARDRWLEDGRIEAVTVADPKPKPLMARKKKDKDDG